MYIRQYLSPRVPPQKQGFECPPRGPPGGQILKAHCRKVPSVLTQSMRYECDANAMRMRCECCMI